MSAHKKPNESGWDSDDDLLGDQADIYLGEKDEELDEDALLGNSDDDEAAGDAVLDEVDDGGQILDTNVSNTFEAEDELMAEDASQGAEETEEVVELEVDDDFEEEAAEEDILHMTAGSDFDNTMSTNCDTSFNNTSVLQDNARDTSQQYTHVEPVQEDDVEEDHEVEDDASKVVEEDESESEDEDDDDVGRGRFRSERSTTISLSYAAKKDRHIPDSLELSKEDEEKIANFVPANKRGRGGRGRGGRGGRGNFNNQGPRGPMNQGQHFGNQRMPGMGMMPPGGPMMRPGYMGQIPPPMGGPNFMMGPPGMMGGQRPPMGGFFGMQRPPGNLLQVPITQDQQPPPQQQQQLPPQQQPPPQQHHQHPPPQQQPPPQQHQQQLPPPQQPSQPRKILINPHFRGKVNPPGGELKSAWDQNVQGSANMPSAQQMPPPSQDQAPSRPWSPPRDASRTQRKHPLDELLAATPQSTQPYQQQQQQQQLPPQPQNNPPRPQFDQGPGYGYPPRGPLPGNFSQPPPTSTYNQSGPQNSYGPRPNMGGPNSFSGPQINGPPSQSFGGPVGGPQSFGSPPLVGGYPPPTSMSQNTNIQPLMQGFGNQNQSHQMQRPPPPHHQTRPQQNFSQSSGPRQAWAPGHQGPRYGNQAPQGGPPNTGPNGSFRSPPQNQPRQQSPRGGRGGVRQSYQGGNSRMTSPGSYNQQQEVGQPIQTLVKMTPQPGNRRNQFDQSQSGQNVQNTHPVTPVGQTLTPVQRLAAQKLRNAKQQLAQKRLSSESSADLIPAKQMRTSTSNRVILTGDGAQPKAAPSVSTEDLGLDADFQKKLELQKQAREAIRKRKEMRRLQSAGLRRKELEKRLAEQGMTIDDIIQDEEAQPIQNVAKPATPSPVKRQTSKTSPGAETPIEKIGVPPQGVVRPGKKRITVTKSQAEAMQRQGQNVRVIGHGQPGNQGPPPAASAKPSVHNRIGVRATGTGQTAGPRPTGQHPGPRPQGPRPQHGGPRPRQPGPPHGHQGHPDSGGPPPQTFAHPGDNMQRHSGPPNMRHAHPGPPSHGHRHPGPHNHGHRHPGPPHQGPHHGGPRHPGPQHQGPRHNGPHHQGPRHNGPRNQGPPHPGHQHQGPRHPGPPGPNSGPHDHWHQGPPNHRHRQPGPPNQGNRFPGHQGPPRNQPPQMKPHHPGPANQRHRHPGPHPGTNPSSGSFNGPNSNLPPGGHKGWAPAQNQMARPPNAGNMQQAGNKAPGGPMKAHQMKQAAGGNKVAAKMTPGAPGAPPANKQVADAAAPKAVKISGLSAGTTAQKVRELASKVGRPEAIGMQEGNKQAIIRFSNPEHATTFQRKFNRHMIDLSHITVEMYTL